MRIQYKPLVRYIWLGAIVMALGGLLAATDRRYRIKVPAQAAAAQSPPKPRAQLGTV
jgi:cytochrome c-type biogenesis protein CcmF